MRGCGRPRRRGRPPTSRPARTAVEGERRWVGVEVAGWSAVCGGGGGGGGCARLRHGVEDALDRVVLDGEEEAARELLARAAGGEHRRRGVRKPLL